MRANAALKTHLVDGGLPLTNLPSPSGHKPSEHEAFHSPRELPPTGQPPLASAFEQGAVDDVQPTRMSSQRNCGLDMIRTICILFVTVAHGPADGERYARANVFDANLWVLYFLTMLTGMLFARQRTKLGKYLLRLTYVFLIGVFFNALAIIVQGGNVFEHLVNFLAADNKLVLQMGYIICIQAFGTYFYILKACAESSRGCALLGMNCLLSSAAVLSLQLLATKFTRWDNVVRCLLAVWSTAIVLHAKASQRVAHWTVGAAVILTVVTFVITLEIYGWDEFHLHYGTKEHTLGPKGPNLMTFYSWGFMWGLVKDDVNKETFMRVVGTYWPLSLPWMLGACVPLRTDLESPQDPWIRAAILASWLTFACFFLFISSFHQEDFLGVTGPLNVWSLIWYCGHMFFGAVLNGPFYYIFLGATYTAAIFTGLCRTRRDSSAGSVNAATRDTPVSDRLRALQTVQVSA